MFNSSLFSFMILMCFHCDDEKASLCDDFPLRPQACLKSWTPYDVTTCQSEPGRNEPVLSLSFTLEFTKSEVTLAFTVFSSSFSKRRVRNDMMRAILYATGYGHADDMFSTSLFHLRCIFIFLRLRQRSLMDSEVRSLLELQRRQLLGGSFASELKDGSVLVLTRQGIVSSKT